MENLRRKHAPAFKAKVALEAIKEQKTSAELASEYNVHPGHIQNWSATATKGLVELFSDKKKSKEKDQEELIQELYRELGQLNAELNWLKKNLALSRSERLLLIDKTNIALSISHQVELLGISRSRIYLCKRPMSPSGACFKIE